MIVCHRKTERGREPYEYRLTWSVSFHVHRTTGELLQTRPVVEELDMQSVAVDARRQISDAVHSMFR